MPQVAVVVPWRSEGPERQRALEYVLHRYHAEHPDWQLRLGTGPPGPWSKGAAVWNAVQQATADLLVIADADVWSTGTPQAVQAVKDGAQWAIPHHLVKRLTQAATHDHLNGQPNEALDEPAYPGLPGGGLIVLPRALYLKYPIDPRFHGWGQEDETFGRVLEATCGPGWRGTEDLIHLWHPPQPRLTRARGNPEGWRLRRRYLKARWDPDQLRTLIQEVHLALDAPEPRLHDPAPQPVG